MAEGSDISIDIVLKEQVKPALDALSSGIAEFTKTLSILTAQAKSAGDLLGKVGTQAEQAGQKFSEAAKPAEKLKDALTAEAKAAKEAAEATARFGTTVDKDSPRIRSNSKEIEALVSSYNRFRQSITIAATTLQNQVRGLRSAKEGFADLRSGINDTVGALTSFKALAIGAVAVLGVFKAKSFIESIVGDAAKLDETLRKAASAVGALNETTTEKLREDLKRLSIEEGADIRALAEAAVGVIPDVGEAGIAEFLKVSQRFSEVAGGNVAQIADTLVFIIKGFGTEADNSSKSMAELASTISDKLYVAAREGNIAIGQLTGIVGLAAQQAEVLGISFDELLAAFTALGDVGVKPMRAFRVLSGVLAGVQEPSVKVVEAISRVNRVIPDLNLDFSRTGLAADGLAKFLGKLTVALKADDDLAKELGFNTRELGLIFKATANGGAALAEQLENIQGSGGEVNRAAEFILEGTEGKLRRISAVFAALKDDIAQVFIPAIDDFLQNFLNGVEGFRNAFGGSLSGIRQAAAEIVDNKTLPDDQKKTALASLEQLQSQVNRAGMAVLAEVIILALKTGAEILGKALLAALARGGLLLKDIIQSAAAQMGFGEEPPSVRLRKLETARAQAVRFAGGNAAGIVPTNIPNQKQSGDVLVAITLLTTNLRALFARFSDTPQAVSPQGQALLASAVAKEFASLLKPDESLGALAASQDPADNERFNDIVVAALSRNTELLQQLFTITNAGYDLPGKNFPDASIISSIVETARELKKTTVAGVGGGTFAGVVDGVTSPNAPEITRREMATIIRHVFSGEITNEEAIATQSVITDTGIQGQSIANVDEQIRGVRAEVAEREAVFHLTIGQLERDIFEVAAMTTKVVGLIGRASNTEDLGKALDAAGERAASFAPLVGAFIELQNSSGSVTETLQALGKELGFVVVASEDGMVRVEQAAAATAASVASVVETELFPAAVAVSQKLGDTTHQIGIAQERVAEQIGESALELAKRFAQIEVARRQAIGSTKELGVVNQINAAIARADELKKQIGLLSDANTAKTIGTDEVARQTHLLREELSKQTSIIFSFTPNAAPLYAEVEKVGAELDQLREKASRLQAGLFLDTKNIVSGGAVDESAFRDRAVEMERVEAELKVVGQRYAQSLATLINSNSRAAGEETIKAVRDAVKKDAEAAEKLLIETVKRAAKLRQESLRTLQKDESGAKQIDSIVSELDRLVQARTEAFGKSLTDETERLNTEIATQIGSLLNLIEGDVPDRFKGAYESIVQTVERIQGATGEAAETILKDAQEQLSQLIASLFGISNQLASDLAKAQDDFRKSEEEFKRSREGRSQTVRVAEVVSQRLAIGPAVPAGNQSLSDRSAGATKAAFEASQQTGREIDFLIDKIKTLEGQLDSVRALQIGTVDEAQRQALIGQITGIISGTEALLKTKLENAGVSFVNESDITGAEVLARVELQLLQVQQQRVPVLETVRQATEAQQKAQEKLANSQKLAAAAGTKQYATLEAVYGVLTFQIDKTKGSIDQQRLALQAYIAELEVIQARLQETLDLNPDLAGDIQPGIDEAKQRLDTAKGDLGALGQGWGGAFGQGFKEGLGAADSEKEFLNNLGRGAGQAIQSNLGTAIDNVIDGTKSLGEAFQQFVSDTLIDIGKLIIKMLILQAIQTALSSIGFFNKGGEVPEPAELNRGGVIPDLRQPRRWNGYNTGGSVNNDTPKQPNGGMMSRLKAAVSRMKSPTPAPQPMFVRAFADGGFVGSDSLTKAMQTIVNVFSPKTEEPRLYETGGFVARNADDTPSISNAVKAISRVFDPKSVQALNTGGRVEESGVSKVLKAISSVLQPKEPEVMALAGGGVAYLAVGGFPSNAPRRKGRVPGPDVNRDVVPAMLTPGEFVMKRSAVSNYGLGVMYAMNEGIVPKDMFGSLPGVRKLATGGTAEATIPPKIEISTPMQQPTQMPQQQSASQAPVPAYIVANEQAMQNLLNGGKNAMIDFMRRNKST